VITIEKHWDGNEQYREGVSGRVYVTRGRWQWLVIVDGTTDSAHDTRRSAHYRRVQLEQQRSSLGASSVMPNKRIA
jgi:hypothetical protein